MGKQTWLDSWGYAASKLIVLRRFLPSLLCIIAVAAWLLLIGSMIVTLFLDGSMWRTGGWPWPPDSVGLTLSTTLTCIPKEMGKKAMLRFTYVTLEFVLEALLKSAVIPYDHQLCIQIFVLEHGHLRWEVIPISDFSRQTERSISHVYYVNLNLIFCTATSHKLQIRHK